MENISISDSSLNLTKKEYEVYILVAQGLTNRAIAYELRVSEMTVKRRLKKLYGKLGINSKTDLMIFSAKNIMSKCS